MPKADNQLKLNFGVLSNLYSTVGFDPRGPGTSKLDWRYLEHNKIDRNELQIRTNSQKGTGTKIAEKLNNFEKFEGKKGQISVLFLPQRPLDDWPDALDHLAIGLVANKCTKLEKISEILLLSPSEVLQRSPFLQTSNWSGTVF